MKIFLLLQYAISSFEKKNFGGLFQKNSMLADKVSLVEKLCNRHDMERMQQEEEKARFMKRRRQRRELNKEAARREREAEEARLEKEAEEAREKEVEEAREKEVEEAREKEAEKARREKERHKEEKSIWKCNENSCRIIQDDEKHACSYEFDAENRKLFYDVNDVRGKSKVVIVTCGKHAFSEEYNAMEEIFTSLEDIGIQRIAGSVEEEIKKPSNKRRVFVLSTQFNAARYPSPTQIVHSVCSNDICFGNPAVHQFVLDNAANDEDERGINNLRFVTLDNLKQKNGYLIPRKSFGKDEYRGFKESLKNMTVFGLRDVISQSSKVDLVYASALALSHSKRSELSKISTNLSKLILLGQYICAMKWAIKRERCQLILSPLGVESLGSDMQHVQIAIATAFRILEADLKHAQVEVYVVY